MLNSGKKKIILTLVLSEKKFLNETKNHNPPPFKLNGRSLTTKHIWESKASKVIELNFTTKEMISIFLL